MTTSSHGFSITCDSCRKTYPEVFNDEAVAYTEIKRAGWDVDMNRPIVRHSCPECVDDSDDSDVGTVFEEGL